MPAVASAETAADRVGRLRRSLGLAAALVAATLLVYGQAWRFGFVLIDDPIYVSENPHVQAGLSLQNVVWSFATFRDGNWIPFTWLSLMLDTTVFGFHAGGYHFTNVLLHVANTVLLFAFLARATGNQLRSACVAALFALHPLHVESVAWITERKDVLSTLFGLLSLLAYVSYAKSRGGWSFAACLLCFVASLLSKQTLVTLPFVFLLLDFWPLGRFAERSARVPVGRREDSLSGRLRRLLGDHHHRSKERPYGRVALGLSAGHTVPERGCGLCGVFGEDSVSASPGGLLSPSGGALLSGDRPAVRQLCWRRSALPRSSGLRRYPYLFVGWAWFLGTLVPMIGFVQVGRQQMADRYTYLPLIGLFVAIVWLCAELVPASASHTRLSDRRGDDSCRAGGCDVCPGWLLARQRRPFPTRTRMRRE